MSTIITRIGKGSPLTNIELDSNFTNLNADKLEVSAFNETANQWFSSKILNDISDVEITSPVNGQVLVWNSLQSKWVNGTVSGGAGLEGGSINAATIGTHILDSFDLTQYSTVKYLIQATSGQEIYSTELTLLHNGVNVYTSEYGSVFTNQLCTFDAVIDGTNVVLNVNTLSNNTYVDFKRITILSRLELLSDEFGDLMIMTGSLDLMSSSGSTDLMQ